MAPQQNAPALARQISELRPTGKLESMRSSEYVRQVSERATAFRRAIEATEPELLGVPFEHFPNGCCGQVAPLLGRYLSDCWLGTFDYVLGEKSQSEQEGFGMHSHAWIERDGLVVDITADQFPEVTESVIVSTNSTWHAGWNGRAEHVADFNIYDARTVAISASQYRILRSLADAG